MTKHLIDNLTFYVDDGAGNTGSITEILLNEQFDIIHVYHKWLDEYGDEVVADSIVKPENLSQHEKDMVDIAIESYIQGINL